MTRQWVSRAVVPALLLAVAVATGDAQSKGRYKKQGANCEWDANDTGPNQCTPTTRGRFKKDGDACRWEANENGADQCRPASGRWKKDGDACRWDGSDSGPDQCNPRAPR
jgi:hypothetical protein